MSSEAEPLRVGATLDGLVVPAWVESLLDALDEDPAFDLRLFVVPPPAPPRPSPRDLALRAYERVDARLFAVARDPFAPRDLSRRFDPDAARLGAAAGRPFRAPAPERVEGDDFAPLREADLDVLLRLGAARVPSPSGARSAPSPSGAPPAPSLFARHGVWSLEAGGDPPFFGEMVRGEPVTELAVVVEGGNVIARSFSATDIASLGRARGAAYWKGVALVLRRLWVLHERGWEAVEGGVEPTAPAAPPGAPSALTTARFAARTWGGVARRAAGRLRTREDWTVGFRRRAPSAPAGAPESGAPFTFYDPPRGHFHADPFLLERDGTTWLYVEDLDWSAGYAGIAVAELTDAGPREFRTVLSPPHHLSYPFVFEHDGETYLVPESAAARTVDLYRAVELPHRFERVATLMEDVEAYDTTLLHRDGRWWMFVTIAVPGGSVVDELFVFSADALTGPYRPHPLNPVVSDVRHARQAGRVLERDGRLIRPAQDSSGRYGRAIVWREIDVLTTEDYAEHTVGRFDPERLPGALATHTYDFSDSFEVVDALRRRRKS